MLIVLQLLVYSKFSLQFWNSNTKDEIRKVHDGQYVSGKFLRVPYCLN